MRVVDISNANAFTFEVRSQRSNTLLHVPSTMWVREMGRRTCEANGEPSASNGACPGPRPFALLKREFIEYKTGMISYSDPSRGNLCYSDLNFSHAPRVVAISLP